MAHFAKFVSLARTPKEIKDEADKCAAPCPPASEAPIYPYGMCLSLDDETLDKLKLDADCDVGDVIHLCCLAKVTSCSKHDTSEGAKRRIELQVTDIALEDEDQENTSMSRAERIKQRYGKEEAA